MLANGLLCWLLLLCFAKGTAKNGTAKNGCLLANALLLVSLSFALVLLKHALVLLQAVAACYTNLFVRYLILMSKYHAEPPTLTRLGASADFLSIELTITYK